MEDNSDRLHPRETINSGLFKMNIVDDEDYDDNDDECQTQCIKSYVPPPQMNGRGHIDVGIQNCFVVKS